VTAFFIENTAELAARTINQAVKEDLGQHASAYPPQVEVTANGVGIYAECIRNIGTGEVGEAK
jgi:hypothetical protein